MKLVITQTCVATEGKIAERGQVIETGVEDRKSDSVAYALIAANRALDAKTPEAKAFLDQIAIEKEEAAAAATAAKKK
jgi:hypothetical protein